MNLDIKIAALDMDGTLLTSDKQITPRTVQALQQAQQNGIEPVICTGRVTQGIRRYLDQIPFVRYLITSNGACVYDLQEKKTLYSHLIPTQKALQIVNCYRNSGGLIEVYSRGVSYMNVSDYADLPGRYGVTQFMNTYLREKNDPVDSIPELISAHHEGVEKLNLSYFPSVAYAQIWNRLNLLGGLSLTYSDVRNIEVNAFGCNKGEALIALAKHLSVKPEQIMAFGDSHNDRQMMLSAGHPIAMGNAEDAIKQLAETVILSNDKEGIAHFLEILLQ